MRTRTHQRAVIALIAAGTLAMSACSSGESVDLSGGSADTASTSAPASDSASSATASDGGDTSDTGSAMTATASDDGGTSAPATVDGPVLVAAIGGEPDQLDPHKTSAYFSFEVLENVYDTLVEPDEKLVMQPALAESWEQSDDQLTWTFTLRQGVTFQDGSEFNADDVVYSFNRIIDEELSPSWRFTAVESVTAVDDYTVEIKVSDPTPNLLTLIGGYKGMAIVEQANVESGDITTNPVGTGPFSVTEYSAGDHITLAANADYWGGAPKIGGVEFRFISEGSTAMTALQNGEVQWTDSIPVQQVSSLSSDDSIELSTEPSNDYYYLSLNEANEPWNDVRARQAIAYAIDRAAILQATTYGTGVENQLAIPKQSDWYTEYSTYSTDADKAQALFDEVGYEGGEITFLATSDYPETVTAAQIIASNLEPYGITVNVNTVDFATWLDEQGNGNFDMYMLSWIGNLDPDEFYYSQHHTDGTFNFQGYSNPDVDALLDAARIETDEAARRQEYADAATMIADDASYIYLYNPAVIQAWSPDVSGYTARADRAIRFRDVELAES